MSAELRTKLEEAIGKFNAKAREDPKLSGELEGIDRKVLVECSDGPRYNFRIENKQMTPLVDGEIADPDVRIKSDSASLLALLKGELKPMKAMALGKVKIKASLEDLMRLRKFF
jgi:putative sterol carrier protein